jgi:hypothetical protein
MTMIKKCKHLIIIIISIIFVINLQESNGQKASDRSSAKATFPEAIEGVVSPYYRHRTDGKPGREIVINFIGSKFSGKGTIDVVCNGVSEITELTAEESLDSCLIVLLPGLGVDSDCEAEITLRSGIHQLKTSVTVPAKRHWTVYIYPHSHVDIGYTNTHKNVEIIHTRNLINGIELAKKTENYPEGARYLWNPEVLWPVERYFLSASEAEKQVIIDAVRDGYLHLDAGYVHTNTTASADEEFFEFFRERERMEMLTGKKIETLVHVDIPGMSWGIVPVAANLGIKYCLALNNGSGRVGLSTDLSFKPFWWLGQDGKSRILFLQPGSYNPGALIKGHAYWPLMAGETDPSKLLQVVKTDHPRDNFIDSYIDTMLIKLEQSDYYPYDIFAMTWAMADNTPIDADLPEAVRSWNEDYAFPHLVIASATDIMKSFEDKYGDQLPVRSGDFTEYWTDGLGTAAKQTGMNRASKERLIQVETLWTMLNQGEPAPRTELEEAWRNVIMGTEHTWCFMDPDRQPITNDILKVKFDFFQKGDEMSKALLNTALSSVNDPDSRVVGVFNSLSWRRGGLVYLTNAQSNDFNSVIDDKGDIVPSQRLSTGELVFLANDVPALGTRKYELSKKKYRAGRSMISDNMMDNGIIKVIIDTETGDISSITDGNHEYVDADANSSMNSYRYLHGDDNPEKASGTDNVKITIKENGPLMASLLIESAAEGTSHLSREVSLIAGSNHIEIINIIDKLAVKEKEGVHFGYGFNISNPVTRADIPWGIMEIEKDQLPEGNRNWIGFQRWIDISNDERGVTFCSLDAPVFESGNMTANVLGMATDSPQWIRRLDPSATIYSWALNNHWFTNFPLSQEGIIQFRYRILPHDSKYDPAFSNRFGLEQAQPLIATTVNSNLESKPPLSVKGSNNVYITVLKTGNKGEEITLRLRSVSAKDESVTLVWPGREPSEVKIVDYIRNNSRNTLKDKVIVPAMGFVTLKAIW